MRNRPNNRLSMKLIFQSQVIVLTQDLKAPTISSLIGVEETLVRDLEFSLARKAVWGSPLKKLPCETRVNQVALVGIRVIFLGMPNQLENLSNKIQ